MKRFFMILMLLVSLGFLVACQTKPTSGGRLKIIVAGNLSQVWEQQFVKEQIIPGFEEEFNAVVDFEILSQANAKTKIETEQKSGVHSTDMVFLHTGEMPEYINKGWVVDITNQTNFSDRTMTTLFDENTSVGDDKYFHMVTYDVYLTIANKRALPYLPKGASVDELTWEEFLQWSINIKNGVSASNSVDGEAHVGNGAKTMFAALAGANLIYEVAGLGLAYGADFVDVDSPGMIEGWRLLNEFARAKVFIPEQNNYATPVDKMKDESAWLSFAHMGPIGEIYSYAPNNFVVAPAPLGTEGRRGTIAGGWGLGVLNGAKNQELAIKFAEYLTRSSVSYKYASGLGGLISAVDEVKDQLGTESSDIVMAKGLLMMQDENVIIRGVPSADYLNWNSIKTIYEALYNKILSGYNQTTFQTQFIEYELPIAKQQVQGLVKLHP